MGLSQLVALFFISAAQAYLPPSFFVVRKFVRSHDQLKDVQITSKVYFYEDSNRSSEPYQETLTVEANGTVHTTLIDASGQIVADRTRNLVTDKRYPMLFDLLISRNDSRVLERLRSAGLPLKSESEEFQDNEGRTELQLDRLDQKFSYVLREKDSKVRALQMWFLKSDFQLMRAILPAVLGTGESKKESGEQILEFRLSPVAEFKGVRFPKAVHVFEDQHLWLKIETTEIKPITIANRTVRRSGVLSSQDSIQSVEKYLMWIR